MINTSEVLNKVGELIANDAALCSICTSTFGRGCQVAVSGYAQKLMGEEDAPFVMVFPDEDEMDADAKEVTNFIAKVVVGFCPVKDVPSAKAMLDALAGISENASAALELGEDFIQRYVPAKDVEDAEHHLELARASNETCASVYDRVIDAAKSGELDAVITQAREYITLVFPAGGLHSSIAAVVSLARGVPEDDHFAGCVGSMLRYRTAAESEIADMETKWADFNENPYIADTRSVRSETSNGLIVFGSLNILDNFRNCINRILNDNDFGLPVTKVTMKNNSSSHYPLEWAEITITFNKPETLSL